MKRSHVFNNVKIVQISQMLINRLNGKREKGKIRKRSIYSNPVSVSFCNVLLYQIMISWSSFWFFRKCQQTFIFGLFFKFDQIDISFLSLIE